MNGVTNLPPKSGTDEHERSVLTKAVTRLFDEWGLSSKDRAILLGLDYDDGGALDNCAVGAPFDDNRELLDRVGHLLSIYKRLEILYPENPEVRSAWASSPNRRFKGKSAVEVVAEEGLAGLLRVQAVIEAE